MPVRAPRFCPSVDPVTCDDPGHVTDAVRTGSAAPFPVGSAVTYMCNTGFGGGDSVCQEDGRWTRRPTCTSNRMIF